MSASGNASAFPLRPMLQVDLSHEYVGGPFAQFATTPLPSTAAAGRNLGLRLLQTGASLVLYVRCNPGSATAVRALHRALVNTTWCWEIAPLAPQFAAVTDLEFAGTRQRVVLTTTSTTGGRLTVRTTASAKDLWDWQPLGFDFLPKTPLAKGAWLDLTDAQSVVLARIEVSDPQIVPIDLSAFGSGLYQLVHGKKILARWFADERGAVNASTAPTSMLVLNGAVLAAAFTKATEGSVLLAPPVYTARYPARDVTWRYHVFNATDASSLQIAALDETGEAPLEGGTSGDGLGASTAAEPFFPVTAPEYPNAASFESAVAYKLVQRPPQRFALLSGGTTVFAPLPVATPTFASRGQSAGFCSDIFVYL